MYSLEDPHPHTPRIQKWNRQKDSQQACDPSAKRRWKWKCPESRSGSSYSLDSSSLDYSNVLEKQIHDARNEGADRYWLVARCLAM